MFSCVFWNSSVQAIFGGTFSHLSLSLSLSLAVPCPLKHLGSHLEQNLQVMAQGPYPQ